MGLIQSALSLTASWVAPWQVILGAPISALEAVAFVLGLWMVWGNFHVRVWAWPLAFISSALYGLLFLHAKLYGEAGLQVLFMVMALWGCWQWLFGKLGRHERIHNGRSPQPLYVRHLSPRGRGFALGMVALLWPALGFALDRWTDSTVPYWDALPTAGSMIGQYLLGRKWVENWVCWLLVNIVSVALFAYKGLWLTVLLYVLFAGLSIWGWQQWRALASGRR